MLRSWGSWSLATGRQRMFVLIRVPCHGFPLPRGWRRNSFPPSASPRGPRPGHTDVLSGHSLVVDQAPGVPRDPSGHSHRPPECCPPAAGLGSSCGSFSQTAVGAFCKPPDSLLPVPGHAPQ